MVRVFSLQPTLHEALCDTPEEAAAVPKLEVTVFRCQDCGHIFNKCRGGGSAFPDSRGDWLDSPTSDSHVDAVADAVFKEAGGQGARVFEIVRGHSELPAKLQQLGVGSISSHDPADWKFSDSEPKADIVVVRRALEEIDDPESLIANVRRRMAPSGKLYVEITNIETMLAAGDIFAIRPHRKNLFSHLSIVIFLANAKFSVFRLFPVLHGTRLSVWSEATQVLALRS